MAKKKMIVRIIGARPQIMQVPTLFKQFSDQNVEHTLVHTGQHYDFDMSGAFFETLKLPLPNFNLEVGSGSQAETTGLAMIKIEKLLKELKPDYVVLDGDTNSTLAGALAAAKLSIPIAHVEAGTRDLDRSRPEELNRIVTDHLATLNFAPIMRAYNNLVNEGLQTKSHFVGDVLLDCFKYFESFIDWSILDKLNIKNGNYNLMTLHRPENTDMDQYTYFTEIISFIDKLDHMTIFPVHPRTKPILNKYVEQYGALKNIKTIDPMPYLQMRALLAKCSTVFTDSGGLPREAVWSSKKCLMFFRQDTWHDLIENKWAGIYKGNALQALHTTYDKLEIPDATVTQKFFGNGEASFKIVQKVIGDI